METLLITTDFSEASRNASFFGVKLAKALGAKVVLLNVYPYAFASADTAITMVDEELEDGSKKGLKGEVKRLKLNGTVEIKRLSRQGHPCDVIVSVAKEVHATLIIAGMKGGNIIARKIFGGTAFSLSRHSQVPLMLVPEHACFTIPKVIALASDISDQTDIIYSLKLCTPPSRFC